MATGSLRLLHSPRLEPLLEALASELAVPLADPFAAELVVVPSGDMERYLKRELARVLGATGGGDGIVSNVEFVYPRQLVNATAQNVVGARTSPWDANNLTWAVVDTLLSHPDLSVPGFDTAPITVARRAADLFDRYASHRPEMLNHWSRGGIDDGTEVQGQPQTVTRDQRWQAELFRRLFAKFGTAGVPPRAIDDMAEFSRLLAEVAAASRSTDRLSVFGIGTLSRAARQILDALAEHWNISVYMVYAAGESWPSAFTSPSRLRSDFVAPEVTHRLTTRWGAQTVESAALFGTDQRTHVPVVVEGQTLLGSLQASIVTDTEPVGAPLSADERELARGAGDGSIQVHACYGLARQVEALRDAILHELNDKPDMRLRDIAILCADIERAAPIITAVFAPGQEAGSALPTLPINVLGGTVSVQDPVVEAFMAVLGLLSSRCTPAEVLDVAQLEPVRRCFGFDDEAIGLLSTWADDLGVRYGVTAGLRAKKWNLPDSIDTGTWDAALNRLMMGVAVPGEVDRLGPGNVVPYDGIGGSEIHVAGAVCEFLARVASFVEIIDTDRGLSVADWCTTLHGVIDSFLRVPDSDKASLVQLKKAVVGLDNDVRRSCSDATAAFSVHELTEMLSSYLADERTMFGNRFESITVAPFSSLQHIPFRVLGVLGADEAAFLGAHSDGDDVLTNHPCVGEPMYSLDGRQRLLNAIMSARDTLIITCTGNDISNNKDVPLAVPVQELLEFTDTLLAAQVADGNRFGSRQLFVRHPRQNFDHRTLTPGLVFGDRPFTFDPLALEAHDVLRAGAPAVEVPTGGGGGSAAPVAPPTLKNLIEVVTRPADFYMSTVLDVRVPQMPAPGSREDSSISGDGVLPLTVDQLSWSKEGRGLLDRIVASGTTVDEAISLWAKVRPLTGTLPPGQLGALVVAEIRDELKQMISSLPPSLQTLSAGVDIDGTVTVDGMSSSMRIQNVHPQGFARVRYRRFTESMVLEPWVELAVLTLLTEGASYEAHLVARAEESGKPPVHRGFVLTGATSQKRVEMATTVLSCVDGMYRATRTAVPPYFERASFVLRTDGRSKAETALNNDLKYSAAAAYVFGDKDAEEVFDAPATPRDYSALGLKPPKTPGSQAALYANHVWDAFILTTKMLETPAVAALVEPDEGGSNG